jgi:hypothetical protein
MLTTRKPLHGLTSPPTPIRELPENDSPTSAVEDNRRSSALSVIIAALNTKTLAENRHISRNRTGLRARNPFLQREETP